MIVESRFLAWPTGLMFVSFIDTGKNRRYVCAQSLIKHDRCQTPPGTKLLDNRRFLCTLQHHTEILCLLLSHLNNSVEEFKDN